MLKDKKMEQKDRETDFPSLGFIPCQVEPGLFRGEYLVYVQAIDESKKKGSIRVQLFVDENLVKNLSGIPRRGKQVTGLLRVTITGVSEGLVHVVLPQPAVPVGESMFVRKGDLIKEGVS